MIPATGRHAFRRVLFVVAMIAVASLSACFPAPLRATPMPSGVAVPLSVAPFAPLVIPRVLAYCPLVDAVHYAGYSLAIDEVYICRSDVGHATDGVSTYGPWETAYRIEHPAALLRAYRVPNARLDGRACNGGRTDPLIVWVHHDGVTTAYYAPVDACGLPSPAATAAYLKAGRTVVVEIDRGAPPSQKDDHG